MYALNLDQDHRILSATLPEYAIESAVLVDELPEVDITVYRYENGKFVEDAEKIAEKEKDKIREKIEELKAKLYSTNNAILEALESIITCTTITGLISTLIKIAKDLKDVLEERTNIRKQIEELEKG